METKTTETKPEQTETKKKASSLELNRATAVFIVGGLVIGLLAGIIITSPTITGAAVSQGSIENSVNAFLSEVLGPQGLAYEILNVEDEGNIYAISISVGEGIEKQTIPIATTKDGKYLITQYAELSPAEVIPATPTTPDAGTGTAATSAEITAFVDCLAEADFKIYGANWCGWTKKTVELFGGFDAVGPIYVECTENEDLCSAEGVRGYPTIKVGGESYGGERTFAAFAEATGCTAPAGGAVVEDTAPASAAGGCGV